MNIVKRIQQKLTGKGGMVIFSYLGLYLISAGIALAVFSYLKTEPSAINISGSDLSSARSKINLNLPKTEACPINGEKFTKIEKNIWETRRPLAAMIENDINARPQSGLSRADVVYEAVAEGGITRFMGVFYCAAAASEVKLAPIRSARVYFVNMAAEYNNPVFLHQGGANNFCNSCPGGVKPRGQVAPEVDAYALLDKLGWRNGQHGNDMDGGFNIGLPIVVRDQYRLSQEPAAWEHSVVASLDEAYREAEKRGFGHSREGVNWDSDYVSWTFQDGTPLSSPKATNINFNFWDGMPDFTVSWKYDSSSNSYKRENGGKPHTDWEFNKPQLTAKNVVVMFTLEKGSIDKEKHMFYQTIGDGKALLFQNGNAIEGSWKKSSVTGRTKFFDKNGKEFAFVSGPIWIEILPNGNKVSY